MDTKVRDIMTPDPVGVYYEQTVAEAARVMRDAGVGAVLPGRPCRLRRAGIAARGRQQGAGERLMLTSPDLDQDIRHGPDRHVSSAGQG